MAAYLTEHPRYHQHGSRYCRCIKVHRIPQLTGDLLDNAFELIGMDYILHRSGFAAPLDEFQRRHNHTWQWGTMGRSGGYVGLYEGHTESSGYQSYCEECGQQNYARIIDDFQDTPEDRVRRYFFEHPHWTTETYRKEPVIKKTNLTSAAITTLIEGAKALYAQYNQKVTCHNRCGRCHAHARVNYDTPPKKVVCWAYRGIDQETDFTDWILSDLRRRVGVVWEFNQAIDTGIANFVEYCRRHKVVERKVMRPHRQKVVVEA